MTSEQARAFASRPWDQVRQAKSDYLVERLRRLGRAEGFRMADELRASVLAATSKRLVQAQRRDDFAEHVRLHRLLVKAGATKRR